MHTLRDIQHSFARGVFGSDRDIAALLLGARGQSGEAGLAIYRNNVLANYRKAFQSTYPVILQLIGAACFHQTVDAYAQATPSRSGDLYDFGTSFADFLADYPPTRALAYLPDMARLEWTIEASDRASAAVLDPARLAAVPPARYTCLRLALAPSARLLASPYPVLRIWQVNQPGYVGDQTVDLASGGASLLIIRRAGSVAIELLSAAEYALLAACDAGRTLGEALECALAVEPACDLDPLLQRHLACGTFGDYQVADGGLV